MPAEPTRRIAFVDYGKGFCIVLVVMMHATLGLEAATGREGFLHAVVDFATPFRMPAFFLIAGLFLSRSIDQNWRAYLDRKFLHFAYFYVLWLSIQFAFKFPGMVKTQGAGATLASYAEAFVQPFGTLWFIYLLPVFFVATKVTRGLPPAMVWICAILLEIAPIETGVVVIDEFAARFVYFYSGYLFAPRIFVFADAAALRSRLALAGLAIWGLVNAGLVLHGTAKLPLVSLLLGFAGAAALIALSALLARRDSLPPLRYCGQKTLAIYLAFFLPMALTREILLRGGWIVDIGAMSLIVTLVAVAVPLMLECSVRHTPLGFLFARPQALRLCRSSS